MSDWQAVLGLEIHIQLATRSKIFSGASTQYGAEPNSQACAVDLGLPGTLPVPNKEAVRMAVQFGLAVGAQITRESIFARKNYFYPDLPKGYQISQYELPIVQGGTVEAVLEDGRRFTVDLTRAHLEEDAGKSIHDAFHASTAIDLNRAGTPLLEIVSEPCMRSAQEATAYMKAVHRLVRWLGICDGNMQEGSFRCDANVSVHKPGTPFGTRAEIKNLNSFKFIEKAVEYEIERQIRAIENGETIVQETRLYDPNRNQTRTLRIKESADDYRYFPDPDLPPIVVSEATIEDLRKALPELPDACRARFINDLGLSEYDADALTADRAWAEYFTALHAALPQHAKLCANWMLGELAAALNNEQLAIEQSKISPTQFAQLLEKVASSAISAKSGKDVFAAMWAGEGEADAIISAKALGQISDDGALTTTIDEIIAKLPEQVAQFKNGDEKVLQFFVGQIMKATRGRANPQRVLELLQQRLSS